jgi:hypothetical protein
LKQGANELLRVGPGLILVIDVAGKSRAANVKIEPSTPSLSAAREKSE